MSPDTVPSLGDRYSIRSLIGMGGMGGVYVANDSRHDRQVAIKVLDRGLAQRLGTERFVREVSTVAKLVHPNIVPIFDSGEFDGQLYYVMPFIEGRSLRHRLEQENQLPLDTALSWAVELADALAYAHRCGFIHRDIKPENILLQADHAMIADFGIARAIDLAAGARLTDAGFVIGTPAYMSPEQALGQERLDGRTDIYSLACVIYELIVGDPPFTGATREFMTARKLAGEYSPLRTARPSVPTSLERCIGRALAPVAADRFAKAEDFRKALRAPPRSRARLVSMALAGAAVAGAIFWQSTRDGGASVTANRVAVGVFDNRTGDVRYDHVGFMASDWVTEGLQRTGVLDVVPTASVLAFSHFISDNARTDPVRAMAEETGAKFIITGSIYKEGDSLVIRAQIADAVADGVVGVVEPIRAGATNPNEGLAQLRSRLMGLLALRLDERFGPASAQPDQPPIFAAYQAFSEGMDAYVRYEDSSALIAFQRANQLDPSFVLPLLYVSICYVNNADYAAADSVLQLVALHRGKLSAVDRHWLEYSQAELDGRHGDALGAIRKAALLTPGSKAVYNFAVQALQARQPFAAESALTQLSPDRGPMRGYIGYWEVLTDALHGQGKHQEELQAAKAASLRFPYRTAAYGLEARALAALRRRADVINLLDEAERRANPNAEEIGGLALEAGSELWAHGDSAGMESLLHRAELAYRRSADSVGSQWGLMQVAAYKGAWSDAVMLGERLVQRDPTRTAYQGALGVALARVGNREQALKILDALARHEARYAFGVPQMEAARVAASLGDSAKAIGLIQAAYTKGYYFHLGPHRDPALGTLRSHSLLRSLDDASGRG